MTSLDPLRFGVEEARCAGDARVVDEQPDLRMASHDGRRHALYRLAIADVAHLVLGAELLGHTGEALGAARDEHAVPAAALQPSRQRGADAARAAGDDRHPHRRFVLAADADDA